MSDTPTMPTPLDWLNEHAWVYAIIGAVGVLIIVAFLLVIVICCYCICTRRKRNGTNRHGRGRNERQSLLENGEAVDYGAVTTKPNSEPTSATREPSVVEAMTQKRRVQEKSDRNNAQTAIDYYIRSRYRNMDIIPLLDMGSRMQKFWFKVSAQSGSNDFLVTIAPISQRCPVKLDSNNIRIINAMMTVLKEHQYIHPVFDIDYLGDRQQLVINQPLIVRGSLKDVIYRATPTSDWTQKYSRRSKGLTPDKVAIYGRHILEAMKFLYTQGFPPLGHVQSGNCFIKDDICRLAGYENTIVGYKTRLYRLVKDHSAKIDVLMFGHLVFEMSCGYELVTVAPKDIDLRNVSNKNVRDLLGYIFEDGFPHNVDDLLAHEFFAGVDSRHLGRGQTEVTLTGEMQTLLNKVATGKAVSKQPKPKAGKKKHPPAAAATSLVEEPHTNA